MQPKLTKLRHEMENATLVLTHGLDYMIEELEKSIEDSSYTKQYEQKLNRLSQSFQEFIKYKKSIINDEK